MAVYEEPGSAKALGEPQGQAQQEGQPSGAHPGYAGGMEAMYGGGSMVRELGDAAANDTAAPESHGQHASFNESAPSSSQPETHGRMQKEADAPVDLQEAGEDPGILQPAAAAKQTDIRVGEAEADRFHEPEGELTADLEDAAPAESVPVPAAVDAEEADTPAGTGSYAAVDAQPEYSKEEAVAGTKHQDTRTSMQPRPAEIEESILAAAAEDNNTGLATADGPSAAVIDAEDNLSVLGDSDDTQQIQDEDSMVEQGQQSQAQASGVGKGQDRPAALGTGREDSSGSMGEPDVRPEQGPSHPEGSASGEALAAERLGMAGSGPAAGPEEGRDVTDSTAGVGSMTGESGSRPNSGIDLDEAEEPPMEPSAKLSDGGGDNVSVISKQVEQPEQAASDSRGVAEEEREADGSDPQKHLKDEL